MMGSGRRSKGDFPWGKEQPMKHVKWNTYTAGRIAPMWAGKRKTGGRDMQGEGTTDLILNEGKTRREKWVQS